MSGGRRPVALVTGGTGGIGGASCRALAEDGYDVAFTWHSNQERRDVLVADLAGLGATAFDRRVDLRDEADVTGLVSGVVDTLGGLDTLVHAGGPYVPQRFVSTVSLEDFRTHVDLELTAFFNLTRAALPHLREVAGSVVAVTTVAIDRFPVRDVLSAAPKAGVEGLVRAIAVEEGRFGVRANCVGPGVVEDGMAVALEASGDFDPKSREYALGLVPLRRFGRSQEVANVVVFLASGRASYVTGQSLRVDGGYSC